MVFLKRKNQNQKKEPVKEKEKSQQRKTSRNLLEKSKLLDLVLAPIITEKSSQLAKDNVYQFKVKKEANKILIKKAIELIYGVKVEEVRTIKVPSKPKRLGRFLGKKPSYKKALVKLKEGESIEITPK